MEKAILNIDTLCISQGMNESFSHQGDLAIDMTNCSYLKAPFTGIIKRIYPYTNTVWLESCDKVIYADGTIDYMTIMTLHDNDVSNLYVGQVIKQGEIYYHPGVKGYVTGSHIHMATCKGKFTGSGWYQNSYGNWCINNQYDVVKALYLDSNVNVINGYYNWKIYSEETSTKLIEEIANEVIKGLWSNGEERIKKLTEAGYDYNVIQNKVNEILGVNIIENNYDIHIVKWGEWLIKIARTYNKDWKKIASDNNLKFPYFIYPDQKLKIYK